MSVVALIAWIVTAMAGIFLLTIWLIEYDPDFQRAAATRLPVPVICGHVLCAVGGLLLWVLYLITGNKVFCWAAASDLALIATLGFTMAARWLGVYRARPSQSPAHAVARPSAPGPGSPAGQALIGDLMRASAGSSSGRATPAEQAVPPERHFPVSVVIAHGVFAVTTVVLVVVVVIRVARG